MVWISIIIFQNINCSDGVFIVPSCKNFPWWNAQKTSQGNEFLKPMPVFCNWQPAVITRYLPSQQTVNGGIAKRNMERIESGGDPTNSPNNYDATLPRWV